MKTKIVLIIMMILFAVSCAKNNPANPVSNTSANNGNTAVNNNDHTKYNTPVYVDDGSIEYVGNTICTTKSLDGKRLGKPENVNNVYIDIYPKDKTARVTTKDIFDFKDIKFDNAKNTYHSSDMKGKYTLTMKIENDSITDFQLIIHNNGEEEKYYYESDKFNKIQKN